MTRRAFLFFVILITLYISFITACNNEPAHTHTWDNGIVTTPATCIQSGVKTYTCTGCNQTRTEEIPATGIHTWDNGTITTPATSTQNGVKTYTCTVCGQTRTEEILFFTVEDPVFSIENNSVVDCDELEITTPTDGATIIYTLDGSEPSKDNGKVYKGPVVISKTCLVKAIAIKDNFNNSAVVSAQYYDVNTPSADEYFTITQQGSISANRNYEGTLPSILIIPSELNGIEVTEIAKNAFKNIKDITLVSIPDTVTVIGDGAFFGCTNIESIDLSVYLTSIGSTAFSGWTEAQRINDYSGLIKAGVLVNCNAKLYVTIKAGTQIVSGYTGMENLYGVYMSNNITTIAENAFSGCVNLEDFTLPEYVTTIGSLAFNECTKIKSITLPATLKLEKFSADAFRGWTKEQTIIDNGGLALNGSFSESNAKVYTTIPSTYTTITTSKFKDRSDIYGVEIPSSVTAIKDNAFLGCNSLQSITLPDTVTSIGDKAFATCANLQTVNLGTGVTTIPKQTFNESPKLSSIIAPNCKGSMTVIVKVPLEQLIVHDVAIKITPAYASLSGYETKISRAEQTIDGDWRVFTYTVDDMIGLYYNVEVVLYDYQDVKVGEKAITDCSVTADNNCPVNCQFALSDLTERNLSATTITPTGSTYLDGTEIVITNTDDDVSIRYTLDGSTPTETNGTLYTEPIVLHELKNVKAVAYKEGYAFATASTNYSAIRVQAPTMSLDSSLTYCPSTKYLILSTETEEAIIYYKIDSSSYAKYESPIEISKTSTVYVYATKDGFTNSSTISAIYTFEHSWNIGEITTIPTCGEEGVRTYTCTICGETKTETIDSTNYHSWNQGVITTPVSCVDGVKTYTCTVCGKSKTESIEATGVHYYVEYKCIGCGLWGKGPSGGYVFYDAGSNQTSTYVDSAGNTVSYTWRYLEAAPTDLSYTNSSGTTTKYYPFGYYRTSSSGSNLTVGTKTAIGTGKANTEALVTAMGETTYTSSSGTTKGIYAAKACADYSITVDGVVYDDWFLPSKDELNLMYDNLKTKGLGSFASYGIIDYWSSSEYRYDDAWIQHFDSGYQLNLNRGDSNYVRPVRAF